MRHVAQPHHQGFVAQGQQARGLQADDGNAAFGKWQQRLEQRLRMHTGLVDHAMGQKRAATAQMTLAGAVPLLAFRRHMHLVARRLQHAHGSVCVV